MAGPPIVIAHRGASGYLPEHTLAAKALAHGMGADYLEQDVVGTRDGELLVFHDLTLEAMTDVARRFPDRARPDGHFYCIDFTLAEIRNLTLQERRAATGEGVRYPGRFPPSGGVFAIPTLEEEILFIQGMNRSTGRTAGLYPEIKHPRWHRQHGVDVSARLLATLQRFGYVEAADAVFVQCFDGGELQRLRAEFDCRLRLIQLLEDADSGRVPTPSELTAIAAYANGIGPSLGLIHRGWQGKAPVLTDLVGDAHRAGLAVHPYTFRADALPEGFASFEHLLDLFVRLQVDGVFTDFPDRARKVVADVVHWPLPSV
jgi:glycerophosphoryl diester phosphodiesterase